MEAAMSSLSPACAGRKRKRSDESAATTSDRAVTQGPSKHRFGASSSSSVSGQPGYEHDVFLSFRGEDTRKGFADSLYNRLKGAGIRVFRDNEELHVGEEIGPELLHAIEHSNISIPIFSKGYASSKWCLKEFAFMMECREARKQTVLPVFYDVTPNEVQHQTRNYAEAFKKHAEEQDAETVNRWRKALAEAGSLKGWELKNDTDGYEGKLIEMIVTEVSRILRKDDLCVSDNLVGIDKQVAAIRRMLGVEASDVRFIVIWGMGGIGKTTLAKVVFNLIRNDFDSCSFIQDARETSRRIGLVQLQSQLIAELSRRPREDIATEDGGKNELRRCLHEKKVLILLDDVDDAKQLDALAAEAGWFGRGSRIIITTRNTDVLKAAQKQHIYEVPKMEDAHALQLFCKHALGRDDPTVELGDLSLEIVRRTGGLPLALEVIGSFLHEKNETVWKATSEKLNRVPHEKIELVLRISYDELHHRQKEMFLDIACIFAGDDYKRIAACFWEGKYRFSPEADIEVLKQLSLIKIEGDKRLWMHDQLRDLGREIDRQENAKDPGQSRRLRGEEALDVLENYQGSKSTMAIILDDKCDLHNREFTPEHFRKLSNLEILQLSNANLVGNFEHLLPKLICLRWLVDPSRSTATNMYMKNLVILNLSQSRVTHDWNLWDSIQKMATKLKVLDLSWCRELTRLSNLSSFRQLRHLFTHGCEKLQGLDGLDKLELLHELHIGGCRSIQKLPNMSNLKSLEILRAIACEKLEGLEGPDKLEKLRSLSIEGCKLIERLPDLSNLQLLKSLSIKHCEKFQGLEGLDKLDGLLWLTIEGCKSIERLPDLSNLKSLRELKAKNLEKLQGLEGLDKLDELLELEIEGCKSIERLPNLSNLKSLVDLKAKNLEKLQGLDGLDKLDGLGGLEIEGCKSIERLPDLSNLKSLDELHAKNLEKLQGLEGLDKLDGLQRLEIEGCKLIERLPDLSNFKWLEELCAINLEKLQGLEGLDKLEGLKLLDIEGCKSIERLPDLSNLKSLRHLSAKDLEKRQGLEGLDKLEGLKELCIVGCKSIERLPDLSNLKSLEFIRALDCEKLQGLEGLDNLEKLEWLHIEGCKSIERLPDLSNLKSLEFIKALNCEKLQGLEGLDNLEKLGWLHIEESKLKLGWLRDLPNLKSLESINALDCERLHGLEGLRYLEELKSYDVNQSEVWVDLLNLKPHNHLSVIIWGNYMDWTPE